MPLGLPLVPAYLRVGMLFSDTPSDGDRDPDLIYGDEGIAQLEPVIGNLTVMADDGRKVLLSNAVKSGTVKAGGRMAWDADEPDVDNNLMVVDLTDESLQERVENPEGKTHTLILRNVRANGTTLYSNSRFPVRIAADMVDETGVVDLADQIPASALAPVVVDLRKGDTGTGVVDAVQPTETTVAFELDDGTTTSPVTLPAGPGGSDTGVAGYINDVESQTREALTAQTAEAVETPGDVRTAVDGRVSAVGSTLYAGKGAVVRPAPRIRQHNALVPTAGGGSFQAHDASSSLADTSEKVLGASSVKLVTAGTGGASYYTLPAVAWDLTASSIRLYLKLDSYQYVTGIWLDAGDPGTPGPLTNRYRKYINETVNPVEARVFRAGEWTALDLPRGEYATDTGTPNWAAITRLRLGVQDNGGGKVTVWINGAAKVPDLAAPVVALTLDDSYGGQRANLFPVLDARGLVATLLPILDQQSNLSYADMRSRRDLFGWEIAAHALSFTEHAQTYVGLTEAQVRAKFDALKAALAAEGIATDSFGWPVGTSDTLAERIVREYFSFALGTSDLVQPPGFTNPMRLRRVNVVSGKTAAQLKTQYDKAKASKGVIIPMIHDVVTSGATGTATTTAIVTEFIDYMIADGATFTTVTGAARLAGTL